VQAKEKTGCLSEEVAHQALDLVAHVARLMAGTLYEDG